jgi:peptide/nickel transport system permease protein
MNTARYILRRIIFGLLPQLLAVSFVAFFLLRLIPGDAASVLLGPNATKEAIASLRTSMGLDDPIYVQYLKYLGGILHGDLGRSWFSRQEVLPDLLQRAPATLELVLYSVVVALLLGVVLGTVSAANDGNRIGSVTSAITQTAGSFPDFWIALIAIFVFFYLLGWVPAPLGRLDLTVAPPAAITGFYTIDGLLAGDLDVFISAVGHLILPVLSLGLILAITVAKTTRGATLEVLRSDYMRHARATGLTSRRIYMAVMRNAAPPIITVLGLMLAFSLGGAVLIERVFSWGGVGEYAVTAVNNADLAPIQGFLLVTATFTMLVYLAVDLLLRAIDPRLRTS